MSHWTRCLALGACLLLLGASHAGASEITGITSFTATANAASSNTRGFRFRAETDIMVTALGMYDFGADGLGVVDGYDVHLWTDAGVELASVRIQPGTASPLVNGFRYEVIASIVLTGGNIYRLSVDYGDDAAGSEFYYNPTSMTTDPNFTILATSGTAATDLTDFGLQGPNNAFPTATNVPAIGPNLQFTVVPEPATALLLGLGLVVLARQRRR